MPATFQLYLFNTTADNEKYMTINNDVSSIAEPKNHIYPYTSTIYSTNNENVINGTFNFNSYQQGVSIVIQEKQEFLLEFGVVSEEHEKIIHKIKYGVKKEKKKKEKNNK